MSLSTCLCISGINTDERPAVPGETLGGGSAYAAGSSGDNLVLAFIYANPPGHSTKRSQVIGSSTNQFSSAIASSVTLPPSFISSSEFGSGVGALLSTFGTSSRGRNPGSAAHGGAAADEPS